MKEQSASHESKASTLAMRGFTLIEMMTVLAILAIVLALAYPAYLESVRKARRADATAALLSRAQVLERCFTRFNSYSDAECSDPTGVSDNGFYTVTVARTATTYALTATPTGDQANDACGTYTVDYLGNRTPLPGGKRCWGSS